MGLYDLFNMHPLIIQVMRPISLWVALCATPAGVVKPLPHELKKNHRGQSKSLVIKEFTGYLYIYY
jgi:hypothetical protein